MFSKFVVLMLIYGLLATKQKAKKQHDPVEDFNETVTSNEGKEIDDWLKYSAEVLALICNSLHIPSRGSAVILAQRLYHHYHPHAALEQRNTTNSPIDVTNSNFILTGMEGVLNFVTPTVNNTQGEFSGNRRSVKIIGFSRHCQISQFVMFLKSHLQLKTVKTNPPTPHNQRQLSTSFDQKFVQFYLKF